MPFFRQVIDCKTGRGSAWLERLVRDQEADSSNLSAPTRFDFGGIIDELVKGSKNNEKRKL